MFKKHAQINTTERVRDRQNSRKAMRMLGVSVTGLAAFGGIATATSHAYLERTEAARIEAALPTHMQDNYRASVVAQKHEDMNLVAASNSTHKARDSWISIQKTGKSVIEWITKDAAKPLIYMGSAGGGAWTMAYGLGVLTRKRQVPESDYIDVQDVPDYYKSPIEAATEQDAAYVETVVVPQQDSLDAGIAQLEARLDKFAANLDAVYKQQFPFRLPPSLTSPLTFDVNRPSRQAEQSTYTALATAA